MSEAKTKYKVVIADDEYVARTLFEMLIQSTVSYELSASFSTSRKLLPDKPCGSGNTGCHDEKGAGRTHLCRNYKKK